MVRPCGYHMAPVVQLCLRDGLEPQFTFGPGQFGEADRHVDEGVPVTAACLEQQDTDRGVLAEPVGHRAACGPRTDDDVVETLGSHSVAILFMRVVVSRVDPSG